MTWLLAPQRRAQPHNSRVSAQRPGSPASPARPADNEARARTGAFSPDARRCTAGTKPTAGVGARLPRQLSGGWGHHRHHLRQGAPADLPAKELHPAPHMHILGADAHRWPRGDWPTASRPWPGCRAARLSPTRADVDTPRSHPTAAQQPHERPRAYWARRRRKSARPGANGPLRLRHGRCPRVMTRGTPTGSGRSRPRPRRDPGPGCRSAACWPGSAARAART